MKISIVTPSFKRLDFFEETIDSIVSQKGNFELEYIVQDGGGDERIAHFLERKATEIKLKYKKVVFKYFIEEDEGMYDAINKGFSRASGDVFAWLNTDDMYHPYALSTVCEIFGRFKEVSWITGIPNSYNKKGQRAGFDSFPNAYSQKFIRDGLYDVKYLDCGFNWLQQESNFWRRELWQTAGQLSKDLKYASDFHLWQSFARHTDLVKVYSFLGGFRNHDNQLTNSPDKYREELPDTKVSDGYRKLFQFLRRSPEKKESLLAFNPDSMRRLEDDFGIKRQDLCGRVVRWSHVDQEWKLYWELIL